MNPANVRLLQQLRADLFRAHQPPSEEVTNLPETVPAVAQHHFRSPRSMPLLHQRCDATAASDRGDGSSIIHSAGVTGSPPTVSAPTAGAARARRDSHSVHRDGPGGLHNTNRHDTVHGQPITVPPLQAKIADRRPSCRNAILCAIDQLHQRTGATRFARRDIVAEVQAASHSFERQTIYRCTRPSHCGGAAMQDVSLPDSAAFDAAVTRLEGLRLTAMEDRFDAEIDLRHGAKLVTELTDLVAAHPLREGLSPR